jgi:hypothetical protein
LLGLIDFSTALADSYTRTLLSGEYVFVSNDLNNPSGNTISNLFPYFDVTVYKLNVAGQVVYQPPGNETLNPGEGALVSSMSYHVLTFSGTQPAAQPPLTLEPGKFHLVGRRAGGLGTSRYEEMVGSAPVEGSLVLRFSVALQDYVPYSFRNGDWLPPQGAPQFGTGESAFVVLEPSLSITNNAAVAQVVTWSAPSNWLLESAPALDGPWTSVTNAVSPYVIPPGQVQQFYRLHGSPPSVAGIGALFGVAKR